MSKSTIDISRSQKAYITGFVLSLLLTLTAFLAVDKNWFSTSVLIGLVTTLALIQFCVQMYYFLHLGQEEKPKLKLMAFWFMLLVVSILVFGSLWIMNNLDYNMNPSQTQHYIEKQDSF